MASRHSSTTAGETYDLRATVGVFPRRSPTPPSRDYSRRGGAMKIPKAPLPSTSTLDDVRLSRRLRGCQYRAQPTIRPDRVTTKCVDVASAPSKSENQTQPIDVSHTRGAGTAASNVQWNVSFR